MGIVDSIRRIRDKFAYKRCKKEYGYLAETAYVPKEASINNRKNLFMYEHTHFKSDAVILNPRAKFIMKRGSGAAIGLLVVTGNHMMVKGLNYYEVTNEVKDRLDTKHEMDKDVVVEENVWIGSRVTLLAGTVIGRGATIGAGSVVRGKIPPYSIVAGNPAKVVGFNFTPDEIIEHEMILFAESERLPKELLEKNYQKYFISRIKDIKQIMNI